MKKSILFLSFLFLSMQSLHCQTKNIWASSTIGGSMGYGTILKGDSDAANFQVVHNFDSLNGSYPIGKMAVANNGKIYCVTELGGCQDSCTCGYYDTTTNTYTMIYQFMLNEQYGAVPYAGVTAASNGLIYGTTASGGAYNYGVIYSIDPATNIYTDVLDFNDSLGNTTPVSELVEASDGNLYGIASGMFMYQAAPPYIPSVLYRFNPATGQYTHLANLGTDGIYVNTIISSFNYRSPNIIQASDNKIYGMFMILDSANLNQTGSLFSYDLVTGAYTNLHNFTLADGYPQGGLIQAGNRKIYGTTTGIPGQCTGSIFSYDMDNSTFTHLLDYGNNTGLYPGGGLSAFGDNKVAGSTLSGGALGGGTLYTYDFTTNTIQDIFDFDSPTTGSAPQCDILKTGFKNTTTTGIPTISTASPAVYPNPATDVLYIQNILPNTAYNITNTLGQKVVQGTITNSRQAIDISQLPAGAYLLNKVGFIKE